MALPGYPRPPFPAQQQAFPGKTVQMDPKPDHGEDSYEGSGQLQGKRTLITGGDSGIGAAVAIAFAREGADVAIAYLPDEQGDAESIRTLIEAAGVRALLVPGDISDEAHAKRLVDTVVAEFGGIDVLVNNAAYQTYFQDFADITLAEWKKTFDTNVHATFHLTQLAVAHMEPGANIINTSSVNSKDPTPNLLPYSTTKGAISNMTVGLAQFLAERKIRVNAVLPGPVWTPFIPAGMDAESVKSFGEKNPSGRPGQPAELASAYVMLASDRSSYTSGALITVAGGQPIF